MSVDWGLFALILILGVVTTLFCIWFLRREYNKKVECGYHFVTGDLQLTVKNCIFLPLISCLGALIAGLCGIGAGFIYNPILININVLPIVASATAGYLTFFTAFSSTLNLLFFSSLPLWYTLIIFIESIIITFPGIMN